MTQAQTAKLARSVSAVLEPVFSRLEEVARVAADSRPAHGLGWSETDLGDVRQLLLELIVEDSLNVGMGFVAAPGAIDDKDRYLLWWQQQGDRVTRLRLNFDRASIDVYDYVEMDWFRLAGPDRPRVTVGPYIDYSGSEQYIVTASVPVVVDGETVGIAGADLLLRELERRLLEVVRGTSRETLIVNSERRIVVANSPRWVPGARLRALPRSGERLEDRVVIEVAELDVGIGWSLVTTGPLTK
jgi:hypothetical protein